MNLLQHFPLEVEASGQGQRLDIFLAKQFPEISRSRWTKLIAKKIFQVSGRALAASSKIKSGQVIEVDSDNEENVSTDEVHFDKKTLTFTRPELSPAIVFEDESILILNKPVGLAVHPGNGLATEETLVAWLIENKKIAGPDSKEFLKWGEDILEEGRPGIVHRLDKGTSGILVVAKNPRAHAHLAKQFHSREAGREYWAVVAGSLARLQRERPARLETLLRKSPCPVALRILEDGVLSLATFLERDPQQRTRYRVSNSPDEGKKAITHMRELQSTQEYSLLNLKLETGRTHQIRIHLSFLGFPIVGDDIYGGAPHARMLLHAHTLKLIHPKSSEELQFQASLPPEDQAWIKKQSLR